MGDPRYRFKRIERRDDIGDIKSKCYLTSAQARDGQGRWLTNYQEDYIRHPIERTPAAKAPPAGLHIGGGNLAPTREEMRTNYQNMFPGVRERCVAQRQPPMPNSKLFEYNFPTPLSTTQAANQEVCENRPEYDNREAKARKKDGVQSHFLFGDDADCHDTQYGSDFHAYPDERPAPVDNKLWKSSVEFDHEAGYGPNTRNRGHHYAVPDKPDADKPDHLKINYDVGYAQSNYRTTYEDSLADRRRFKKPEACKAPACATLSDHGDAAGRWGSTYNSDFTDRKRDENDIDLEDLRRTHFDLGHDETDWSRRQMATTPRKPAKEHMDLQQSNVVFKGDGTGRYETTAQDLLGVYDRNEKGCFDQFMDARSDHLHVGDDAVPYETTSASANRQAGKGRPAERCVDLHRLKGAGFATGGDWDPFAGKDLVSEKRVKPVQQPQKLDGRYFTGTHFDLDATAKNKPRYKTEYFERICRPKLQ